MTCIFCDILSDDKQRIILENDLCFSIYDKFPITPLHSLIIPKRHISSYFELTTEEIISINELLKEHKHLCEKQDSSVLDWNIGVNCGKYAGQTIFHCHIHLLPRRKGDVENPKGGVRHLFPGKGFYDE